MANRVAPQLINHVEGAMKRSSRRGSGVSIVELAAALVIGLPLVMTVLYITMEASILFAIRANIDIAARNAARYLATAYQMDPSTKGDSAKEDAQVTRAFVPKYAINTSQFTVVWADTVTPATVTVACKYGGPGLSPFPNPDPLKLGGSFRISSMATFPLE